MMGRVKSMKRGCFEALFVAILATLVWDLDASPVQAATGDQLRRIIANTNGTACAPINQAGDSAADAMGFGIAFDGVNLMVSCFSDNTITVVKTSDGSRVGPVHHISGASFL